jgi:hypothetical protein
VACSRASSRVSFPVKKGWRQERYRIAQLRREPLASAFMANIRGKDIAEYRDMRLRSVAHNTVRNELNLISHVFEPARKEWGMEGLLNPTHDVSRPAPGRARNRRLKGKEEAQLLAACKANHKIYKDQLRGLCREPVMTLSPFSVQGAL